MYWSVFVTLYVLTCAQASRMRSDVQSEPAIVNNVLHGNPTPMSTAEDSYLNITQLAVKYGYFVEEHSVTTEDGYVLGLHRLTRGKSEGDGDNGIPIFLMHGLLDTSDGWILQGPGNALGYLLADKGYDVWLGNARGNKHSLTHTTLSPNEVAYWDFSWEEIGVYDLPAMIDYVLVITGKNSLYYAGHSQGSTSFFAMNSLKPEYNGKVKMMFALSPVTWMSHAESPIVKYLSPASVVIPYLHFFNTLSPTDGVKQLTRFICNFVSAKCTNIFDAIFGQNYFVNKDMFPFIIAHSSGSSLSQFLHYGQLYQSGRFCRYDHGWVRNMELYGAFSPPDYNLSNITVPVVLFYSGNDWLSNRQDVATLYNHLPHVHKTFYSDRFNHIDYVYASVAKDAIYLKIINEIEDYEQLQ